MTRLWLAVAATVLLGAVPAAAQEGRWVLRAEDRAALMLDLRPDLERPGGWRGELVRPQRMSVATSAGRIFGIAGPLVRRSVAGSAAKDGTLALVATGGSRAEPDRYVFRLTSPATAELNFAELPSPGAMPPMQLVRARDAEEVAAGWDASRGYAIDVEPGSNPEMSALFAADQAARADPVDTDWSVVAAQDEARRRRTRALLDAGALTTATDFYHAAFIFQHGAEPDDYLLAHSLAMAAVARGRADANWIGAAALDRFLQNIGRPQIFGTQFRSPPGAPTTQEPYRRDLVPDSLRRALGVPLQAEQERQRAEFEAVERQRRQRQQAPAQPPR